ncbi:type II secretion system F family protein [Hamadaea tsunoensis]|uniref:type II secretion system F family protein n=1 Tax=Hamadaea tsunoensis TaxID=53368 RepID=UPI0004875C9F
MRARRRLARIFPAPRVRRTLFRAPLSWTVPPAAALVAGFLGGPVAALIALAYALLGVVAYRRMRTAGRRREQRSATLDALADTAAALRAGARRPEVPAGDADIQSHVDAAVALAERTGAPLADLLDRIEEEHRAAARRAARGEAEAAGSHATVLLLLLLPIGGLLLGELIGVRGVPILLRTPIGAGCAAGALLLQVAGVAWMARIARPARPGTPDRRARRDLPLAAELLAAVLRSGVPVDHGVLAVADVLPLGDRLARVGRALRLGAPAEAAWRHLAGLDGARRLVTAAIRSAGSGAALASTLHRVAADLRAEAADQAEARARRAAVLLVLPLGLCFLPAFVLAGLAPVVIAVAGQITTR